MISEIMCQSILSKEQSMSNGHYVTIFFRWKLFRDFRFRKDYCIDSTFSFSETKSNISEVWNIFLIMSLRLFLLVFWDFSNIGSKVIGVFKLRIFVLFSKKYSKSLFSMIWKMTQQNGLFSISSRIVLTRFFTTLVCKIS